MDEDDVIEAIIASVLSDGNPPTPQNQEIARRIIVELDNHQFIIGQLS
jgi:hypothetical protein